MTRIDSSGGVHVYVDPSHFNTNNNVNNGGTNYGANEFWPGEGWDLGLGPLLKPGSLSSAEVADILEQLLQERTAVQEQVAAGNIADNKVDIQKERKLREEKKEEVASAQKEAADKAAKSGVFNKVFGWVMAVATLVAGIAMIASGAGAVAGGMMIAAAAVQIAQLSVEQAVEDGNLQMDDKQKEVFGYAMMAISIALSVGGGLAAGAGGAIKSSLQAAKEAIPKIAARISQEGLANVAKEAAKNALQAAGKAIGQSADDFAQMLKNLPNAVKNSGKNLVDALKHPVDTVTDFAKDVAAGIKANPAKAAEVTAMTVDAGAGAANGIVQGQLTIQKGAAEKRAAEAAADAQEAITNLAKLMLINEELTDQLKEVLKQLQDGSSDILNILKLDDEQIANARPIMT